MWVGSVSSRGCNFRCAFRVRTGRGSSRSGRLSRLSQGCHRLRWSECTLGSVSSRRTPLGSSPVGALARVSVLRRVLPVGRVLLVRRGGVLRVGVLRGVGVVVRGLPVGPPLRRVLLRVLFV